MTFKSRTQKGMVVLDNTTWRRYLLQNYEAQWGQLLPGMPPLRIYLSPRSGFNLSEFVWRLGAGPETGKNWRDVLVERFNPNALALVEFLRDQSDKTGMVHESEKPPRYPSTAEALATQFPPAQNGGGVASLFAPAPEAQPNTPATGFATLFGATPPAQEEEPPAPSNGIANLFK